MMTESFWLSVSSHEGEFLCREIGMGQRTKSVRFRHRYSSPANNSALPPIPGIHDFYQSFGSLDLYFDDESQDAAYSIVPPESWPRLDRFFRSWFHGIDESDLTEIFPSWISHCIVVGEIPRSGNYLVIPTTGSQVGHVFEFDHETGLFAELGETMIDFVQRSLDLDSKRLMEIAGHVRFISKDSNSQWGIEELSDNRGNRIRTRA